MKDEGQDDPEDIDRQLKGSRRKTKQINKNVTFKEETKKAKSKTAPAVEKPI
jgi:hypothetical protein